VGVWTHRPCVEQRSVAPDSLLSVMALMDLSLPAEADNSILEQGTCGAAVFSGSC